MITTRRQLVAACIACAAWGGSARAQGLYWESRSSGTGPDERVVRTYAMPKMIKIVAADGRVLILRADQEKVIDIDPHRQAYKELTFAEIDAASKEAQQQMEAARALIAKDIEKMPPEQRAMVEKLIPAARPPAPAVSLTKTGETKTIAGYTCTKYVASEAGKPALTVWVTHDVKAFDGLRQDWVTYEKRMVGMTSLFSGRAASGGAASDSAASGRAASPAEQIDGFPMEIDDGNEKSVVTKVEARTIPASEFEAPAGYTKEKVDLPKPAPH